MSDNNYFKITQEEKSHINVFKQIGVQYDIKLPNDMKYIDKVIDTHISAKIQKYDTSFKVRKVYREDKKVDDKCVLIIGQIISGIEYIDSTNSLHYMEHTHLFSSYIVIDDSMDYMNENSFKISIVDSYIKKVDKEKMFQSVLLLIHTMSELILDNLYTTSCTKEGSSVDISKINHSLLEYSGKCFRVESLYNKVIQLNDKYPNIKKVLSMLSDTKIISYRVINTIEGTSKGGQQLSGKVLMVEMNIGQKILYIAKNKQSIHGLEYESLHIAYVVIPSFITGSYLDLLIKSHFMNIKVREEFASVKKINEKKIYTSVNIYVEVSCENYI